MILNESYESLQTSESPPRWGRERGIGERMRKRRVKRKMKVSRKHLGAFMKYLRIFSVFFFPLRKTSQVLL